MNQKIMIYESRIDVRGYELDSFGHVNNAVFLKYCEEARWQILRKKNMFDYLYRNRLLLVVASAQIRYVKEAKVFDELVVNTSIKKTPPYLEFNHIIRHVNTGDIITRAKIKTLLVDHDRIPYDIPDSLAE